MGKNRLTLNLIVLLFIVIINLGCNSDTQVNTDNKANTINKNEVISKDEVVAPIFNEDSAYIFIEKQVKFGPRVPNTTNHKKCGDYLINTLKSFGAEVNIQEGEALTFDNKKINIRNITAQFQKEKKERVLLMAHYDTRPFADKDIKDKDKPIDGANDGASGVGLLLEISRLLSTNNTNIGIDIVFFDAEDYGLGEGMRNVANIEDDWCLGSQYWSKNIPIKYEELPKYGILVDMIAEKGAKFYKEYYSYYFAEDIVNKVWDKANSLGYSDYFVNNNNVNMNNAITDDHRYVNIYARIPSIDIISYTPNNGFGSYHHTHNDNMSIIDKKSLKAVGQTLLQIIYNEK